MGLEELQRTGVTACWVGVYVPIVPADGCIGYFLPIPLAHLSPHVQQEERAEELWGLNPCQRRFTGGVNPDRVGHPDMGQTRADIESSIYIISRQVHGSVCLRRGNKGTDDMCLSHESVPVNSNRFCLF